MSFHVRTATAADTPAVVALFGILDDLHTAGVPHRFNGSSQAPRSAQYIAELIASPKDNLLVAEAGGQVVGHVVMEAIQAPDRIPLVPRRFGLIHDLVVAEAMRGRGIGRALVAAAERWLMEQGIDSAEITVWAFNADALRLYERLGYEVQFRSLRRRLP